MPFGLRIDQVTFSGRQNPVEMGESDLVVLVGPNNSGKSLVLREIQTLVGEDRDDTKAISGLVLNKEGDAEELAEWLKGIAKIPKDRPDVIVGQVGEMHYPSAIVVWDQQQKLNALRDFMVLLVNAEARLHLAAPRDSIDTINGVPREPLQRLLLDTEAELRVSRAVERAYGQEVSINRAGGTTIHLLLGRAESEPRLDNPQYLEELAELPLVSEQGDGVRSFIGLLLMLEASKFPVVLVDEPEAFLHPPQAREMGRRLGETDDLQRFVATHDSDVLLGLLDKAESPLIIRLSREGDTTVPAVLGPERVRELWKDPSFRYSRLLDGLFHQGAVVCEADGDATLYSAALDAELEDRGEFGADLLFTQCGGKHKMPAAIEALRPMGVPVAAILDLDVFRDESLLSQIVGALGGVWETYKQSWKSVSTGISNLTIDSPLISDVKSEVAATLGEDPTARITEGQSRRIREITKRSDGWRVVRERGGLSAMPRGDTFAAAEALIDDLAHIGLFVVPVGALEGWAPEIGGHGPKFVAEALSKEVHLQPGELREFVLGAATFLQA